MNIGSSIRFFGQGDGCFELRAQCLEVVGFLYNDRPDMRKPSVPGVEGASSRSLMFMPLFIVALLVTYKTNASVKVLSSTWSTGTIAGKPGVVAFGLQVGAIGALQRSENYFLVIWPALVFGILIASSVKAFVSPQWIARVLGERSMKTQISAGLAGAPLMLCSCCVAPVFTSVAESSGRLGPAIGLMLSSPSLNPAAIALTFMLFQAPLAVGRLVAALAAVLFIGSLTERLVKGPASIRPRAASTSPAPDENAAMRFLRAVGGVSLRTLPGVVIGVFASMLLVQFLPPALFTSPGARIMAILITATLAVPLALPTFLEIPLSLGLLAAGFPAGAAVALLFAGPAINLPSLWSIARISGWRIALLVAASVWGIAVLAGLAVGSLV